MTTVRLRVAALVLVWLLLQQSLSPGHLLLGAILGTVVPLFTRRFWPEHVRVARPLVVLRFITVVLWDILAANFTLIDDAFRAIIEGAFSPKAYFGGFLGVLAIGFKRAAFSNEAGAGSAAIAHSAARTPHPTREGENYSYTWFDMFRVVDGRLAEHWDQATLFVPPAE